MLLGTWPKAGGAEAEACGPKAGGSPAGEGRPGDAVLAVFRANVVDERVGGAEESFGLGHEEGIGGRKFRILADIVGRIGEYARIVIEIVQITAKF